MSEVGPGILIGAAPAPDPRTLLDILRDTTARHPEASALDDGAIAIVADLDLLLRTASWCQCAAVLMLSIEYLRARRLSYAPPQLRLPPGAVRPHLIYANPTSKE